MIFNFYFKACEYVFASQGCSSFQNQRYQALKNSHSPTCCFIATSMCMLWFYNNLLTISCMSAGSSCPRLRLQSLYLHWGYPRASLSHRGLGGLQPCAAAASLGTDPGPAIPVPPHGVPDCPAMWVHTRWPGQLLTTRAAHCLLFLLPPGLSSVLTRNASLSRCLSLMKPKFKEKI